MPDDDNPLLLVHDDGEPLCFFLHKSIRLAGARDALQNTIDNHGGIVVQEDTDSDIILVDTAQPSGNLDKIRRAYKTHSDPRAAAAFVEPMGWVRETVKTGKIAHSYTRKRMGGVTRDNGRARQEFTADDDNKLIRYLGVLIPDKSEGGRLGKNVYKQLMEHADTLPNEYAWVSRHTWQSWRERYKKNQEWFDAQIEDSRPDEGTQSHQRYELSRKAVKGIHYQRYGNSEERDELEDDDEDRPPPEEEEEENSDQELENIGTSSRKRRISEPESQPSPKRARTQTRGSVKGKERAIPDEADELGDLEPPQDDMPPVETFQEPLHELSPPPPPRTPAGKARPVTKRTTSDAQTTPRRTRPKEPVAGPSKEKQDAPARNTRSRSRSAPPADIPPPKKTAGKGKGKKTAPALEVVPEVQSETQTDEDHVQELLVADMSGVSEEPIPRPEEDEADEDQERHGQMPPPPPPAQSRIVIPRALSKDDAQTDAALRRPARRPLSEMLAGMQATRMGSRQPESVASKSPLSYNYNNMSSAAATAGGYQNMSPDDVFSSTSRRASEMPSLFATAATTTRAGSASSTDSFPLPGTRAKSVKRELRQQEKLSPYRPPSGTRAEAVVLRSGARRGRG
ncbi:Myb-DNA-bind-2 domain-containing protein [Mycena chlorophos]|uniref:Myb-DNA-bind-2 domain-containing protein n=1 Tax=Mycena chlorophos TaxID=658473 RepID=A0A8H6TTG0_MYCCL|nr:Myb-DNA-bind-2 domain-containing protein [Mycena chlorophos]